MRDIIETPRYLKDAKRARLSDAKFAEIRNEWSCEPPPGVVIPGTGGARKLRLSGHAKGKSGGYRVIGFALGSDGPLYLLALFSKSERVDLTQAERNQLRDELTAMAVAYEKAKSDDHGGEPDS